MAALWGTGTYPRAYHEDDRCTATPLDAGVRDRAMAQAFSALHRVVLVAGRTQTVSGKHFQ